MSKSSKIIFTFTIFITFLFLLLFLLNKPTEKKFRLLSEESIIRFFSIIKVTYICFFIISLIIAIIISCKKKTIINHEFNKMLLYLYLTHTGFFFFLLTSFSFYPSIINLLPSVPSFIGTIYYFNYCCAKNNEACDGFCHPSFLKFLLKLPLLLIEMFWNKIIIVCQKGIGFYKVIKSISNLIQICLIIITCFGYYCFLFIFSICWILCKMFACCYCCECCHKTFEYQILLDDDTEMNEKEKEEKNENYFQIGDYNSNMESYNNYNKIGENNNGKIIAVNFISTDQTINLSIAGKNTETFGKLLDKLLIKNPGLKNKEVFYYCNGNPLDPSKTLIENKIKYGDQILISIMD